MLQNEGQVAFITGAGGGIGRAIAEKFAKLGCSVIVADINPAGAEETVALLEDPSGKAKHAAISVDVTKKADVVEKMTGNRGWPMALRLAVPPSGRIKFTLTALGKSDR